MVLAYTKTMTKGERPKLAIIDGKSVFYRGYYAMPNLATKDGTPTGGVYGFATMALEVLKRLKPDYVCVAWDKPKTNIRRRVKLYPQYKANRKPAPPDFYEQIPVLHELLDAFGWPLYELDDYEADDIMGALGMQAAKKDIETMLITSDLDMLQLIDPHVHVYALKKGLSNIELYSPKSFEAKYGIKVNQFLDLKALKGDSSDNIPGVPGIGEKGALALLQEFQTLDGIYENLDLIKESTRKKLEAGKESAYLSKDLAAIWTDAPIKLNLEEVNGSKCDPNKLHELLVKLEFRSLARQLPEIMQVDDEQKSQKAFEHQYTGNHSLINSAAGLAKLKLGDTVVVHSRCAGKHGQDPQLLIISPDPKHTYTLDLTQLNPADVGQALKPVKGLIGYDIKSTLQVLLALNLPLPAVEHDVQIGAFLINGLKRITSLTDLASDDLGYDGSSLDSLDNEELVQRAPEIVHIIRALHEQQLDGFKKAPKLPKLAAEIEWPVIPVLARMEYAGIELNTGYLKKFSVEIEDSISDLQQKIYGHADQEFNISSPGQLAEVLFDKMALPTAGIKKGKTGYSTAATELAKLQKASPIIDLITQYREVTKLKNTYIDTLPTQVDEQSRVHTTYAMTVAPTGRLSSNDPNLQNIPTRTDLGRRIRTAFVAGKGKALVSADYSQFELRLAAYLCEDKDLIDQFNKDIDVHVATAAEVYNKKPAEVTKAMRRDAKVVNFGVMYGLSTHGLAEATGMDYAQAKEFIQKYFEVRPKLRAYIDSVKKQADEKGYVETLYGRRRPTPDVKSSNFMVREGAYRAAINLPFQGSAADIMKLAMIAIQDKLDDDCRMLLQIHDSVLVECPSAKAKAVAKLLKDTMEGVVKLSVKLTVDTAIGKDWGEL